MNFKKSMVSIAAATLIVAGFAGCDTGSTSTTTSTTSTTSTIEQNAYQATVTGAVMNDLGQPVKNARVYLAGQTALTDSGGIYNFKNVNISDYITQVNGGAVVAGATSANAITVSVIAPDGTKYNNAFAQVTTEMIHIENVGEDQVANAGTNGTTNVQPVSQSFTVNADVGIVMLSQTTGAVKGVVRDAENGTVIPAGTKIIATYTGVNTGSITILGGQTAGAATGTNGANSAGVILANTTTGVNSVTGEVGVDGTFKFTNLLTSSTYNFTVEGYKVINAGNDDVTGGGATLDGQVGILTTGASDTYSDGDYVTDTGNVMVKKITATDTLHPYIVSVDNDINEGKLGLVRLEDQVRNVITIRLSEDIATNSIVDKDTTPTVTVYSTTRNKYFTLTTPATINGSVITVTLDEALTDGELFDINLLKTDFKDAAGNFIDVSANNIADPFNADSPAGTNNSLIKIKLQAYDQLIAGSAQVTFNSQMAKDNNGPTEFSAIRNAHVVFNDAMDNTAKIEQMNSLDDDVNTATKAASTAAMAAYAPLAVAVPPISTWTVVQAAAQLLGSTPAQDTIAKKAYYDAYAANVDSADRLTKLATDLSSGAVTVAANTARVTFTPSGAPKYAIHVINSDASNRNEVLKDTQALSVQGEATLLKSKLDFTVAVGYLGAAIIEVNDPANISAIEFTLSNLRKNDTIVITPVDDFDYAGTPALVPVKDNVEPTTVLQNAYGSTGVKNNGGTTADNFGDGGELSNNSGTVTIGTPYLPITPDLLNNKNGVKIVSNLNNIIPNNTLDDELSVFNTVDTITIPNAKYITAANTYDSNAYAEFEKDAQLIRTIGVAFSEDINITGINPTFTKTSATLATTANGFVASNDTTFQVYDNASLVGTVNVDLVDFVSSNVLKLANIDNGAVLDFVGISDKSGVVSTDAKVVIKDEMPPFVTKAEWNSANAIITFNEPINIPTAAGAITIDGIANAMTNPANYSLSDDFKTLTIKTAEFPLLTINNFGASATTKIESAPYKENVFATTSDIAHDHASMTFDGITDRAVQANSWNTYTASIGNVTPPKFAIADTTPVFAITTTNPTWSYTPSTNTLTTTVSYNQAVTKMIQTDWRTGNKTIAAPVNVADITTVGSINDYLTFDNTSGNKVTDVAVTAPVNAIVALNVDGIGSDDVTIATGSQITWSADKQSVTVKLVFVDVVGGTSADTLFTKNTADNAGNAVMSKITFKNGIGDGTEIGGNANAILSVTIN